MNVFELFAKLNLDSKGYERSLSTAEKRLDAFGRSAQRIGTSLTAAVTAPIAGLSALAVRAFGEQERAELQLRAALEANGREVDSLFERYTSLASALQDVTVIGDETTIRMFSQAEALGLTGDAAERAVRNAIGLSSALDLNARSALRYTAVLEEGDTTMLQRYLPALRSIEDESEKVALAQEMLARMFGSATAEAESATGQITQMRNAVGDLLEVVGGIVSESLLPFVNRLQDLAERAQNLDEDVLRLVVQIGSLAAAIGPALIAIGLMASGLSVVIGALTTAGPVIALVAAVLFVFRDEIGNVLGALANLADNWPVFVEGLQDTWSAFVDLFQAENDRMFASFDMIAEGLRLAFVGATISAIQSVEGLINNVIRLFNGFISRTNEVFGTSLSLAEEFDVTQTRIFQRLQGTYDRTADRYLDAADRQTEATERVNQAADDLRDGFSLVGSAFTDLGDDAEDTAETTETAFSNAAENILTNVEGMANVIVSNVERTVSRSIEQILRFRPAIREVVGRGPGERPTGPDPFAEDRARQNIANRRTQEEELNSVRELSAMREADLTRRYQREVEARQQAAKEEAAAREAALQRQTEAAQRAMQIGMQIATSFQSAFQSFSNNLVSAVGNMVIGVEVSMEQMANVVSSGVTAFLSGVGQMIGSAIAGEEGIGQSFARMLLQMIASLSSMILGIMITAKIMGAQWWNPLLAVAGGLGFLAASAGLAALAGLANNARSQAKPSPPPNEAPEEEQTVEADVPERDADVASDRDMGASFGGTSQGVQLAVAVPLMDAATIMQSAARSMQAAFGGDGMNFSASTMSFDSSVERFGSYVDRLVDTGIMVNVQGGSNTASLRGT